jgi:hypothetical protein
MSKSVTFDPETGDYVLTLDDQIVGYAPTAEAGWATLDQLAYARLTHASRTLPDPTTLWQEYQTDSAAFYARLTSMTTTQLTAFATSFAAFATRQLDCPSMPQDFLQVWAARIAERQ